MTCAVSNQADKQGGGLCSLAHRQKAKTVWSAPTCSMVEVEGDHGPLKVRSGTEGRVGGRATSAAMSHSLSAESVDAVSSRRPQPRKRT